MMTRTSKLIAVLLLIALAPVAQADDLSKISNDGALFRDFVQQGGIASPEDTGFDNDVRAITTYNGDLIVGGYFYNADGFHTIRLAGYDGHDWYPMNGFHYGNPIYYLHVHDGLLYAGQALTWLNSWDGSSWTHYEPSLSDDHFGNIWALETYNNELYVGGGFDNGTDLPPYIAIWNGADWDSVGTGIQGSVVSMEVYDNQLYAGGWFNTGDGSAGDRIATWDGSTWSAVGAGMADGGVRALLEFDGDLIAGGTFTDIGGNPVGMIARWDGSAWYNLGSGLDGWVEEMTVYNGDLIVGGRFTHAGGISALSIARWDGSSWSAIGPGFDDDVYTVGVWNGYLIAGGAFSQAGGYVALWDGSIWRPVSDIVTDVTTGPDVTLPDGFALEQNRPNPFNPSTLIEFEMPYRADARIEIININGQHVKNVLNRTLSAGPHSVVWNGTDETGQTVASGMYFYRLRVDDYVLNKKMVLLK